jgi:uncharacterized membrane protein
LSPVLALLALAAQAAQPAEPDAYSAVGANPFWGARIGGGRLVFETPGRDILNMEAPPRQQTELGLAYSTPDFSISVEHANCTDPPTRQIYADRVTVRVGETHFEGCGGTALSPALPAPYAAAGGEPFWWVEIGDGRITWQIDDRVIIVPVPALRSTRDGRLRVYETPSLTVTIRRQDCELDDDHTYADAVTVTAGARTVEGCGGNVVREAPDD